MLAASLLLNNDLCTSLDTGAVADVEINEGLSSTANNKEPDVANQSGSAGLLFRFSSTHWEDGRDERRLNPILPLPRNLDVNETINKRFELFKDFWESESYECLGGRRILLRHSHFGMVIPYLGGYPED